MARACLRFVLKLGLALALASLALAQNTTNTTAQRGVPLVPVDKGGVYTTRLYQSWPLENYNGEIKTMRYARATRMLYMAVSNAIMRVNMTSTLSDSDWSTKASRLEYIPRVDYATKFVDMEYNALDDNVYALGLQPSVQIAKFSGAISLKSMATSQAPLARLAPLARASCPVAPAFRLGILCL